MDRGKQRERGKQLDLGKQLALRSALGRRDKWLTVATARSIFEEDPDIVRQLRELAGFSQEEVATALGKSRPAVTQWETGVRRPTDEQAVNCLTLLVAEADLSGLPADLAATLRAVFPASGYQSALAKRRREDKR